MIDILRIIGVTTDERTIRKVEKLVEIDCGLDKRNLYRDHIKEEDKRRLNKINKNT